MRVSIISFGKFHAFDLARELKANKLDVKLYSSYPYFIAKKYGLKPNEHYSFFLLQLIDRFSKRKFSYYLKYLFAQLIKFQLKFNQDYIIAWSDTPNFLIKYLKTNYRSTIILERGSTHIDYQFKILKEEYNNHKLEFQIPYRLIKNELENYKDSDFISIPSKFVYNSFIESNFSKTKLMVNPYGSDLTKFFPIKNSNEIFTILTVGHGSLRKGLLYVLKAHNYINGKFIHYHVGSIDNYIKEYSRSCKNFKQVNSLTQEKLRNYYQTASVFILASLEEGLSLTILEAMACGLPIITTKNSGVESIESDLKFGEIISPKNPLEIAEKVNRLISNSNLRSEYSKNALKIVSRGGYSWSDYGKRYYQNLLKL